MEASCRARFPAVDGVADGGKGGRTSMIERVDDVRSAGHGGTAAGTGRTTPLTPGAGAHSR